MRAGLLPGTRASAAQQRRELRGNRPRTEEPEAFGGPKPTRRVLRILQWTQEMRHWEETVLISSSRTNNLEISINLQHNL